MNGHSIGRTRQRGAALLVLTAVVVLASSWMLVSALDKGAGRTARDREHNARVLAEAKAALIAWVATNALDTSEVNPGRLPCPQYWGDIGSAPNEGRAGASCISSVAPTQPGYGWLPWKTLGVPKRFDAAGGQLWYVVSPGWANRTDAAKLTINSSSLGQLMVDGQANAAVALIIAPGRGIGISPNANQTAAGCTARNQSQVLNVPSTAPNPLDFLECQNGSTTDGSFVTSVVDNAVNPVFNDQVIVVTVADILPALEAAIAKRIERDIVPQLKIVYGDPLWGTTASAPAFPLPASFTDPSTSAFLGVVGQTQGLLPFNYHSASCPGGDPRCSSNTISWIPATPTFGPSGGPGYFPSAPSCYWSGSTRTCEGYFYGGSLNISFTDTAHNITTGMRTFTSSAHNGTVTTWNWNGAAWDPSITQPATTTRALSSTGGDVNFVTSATLPSVATWGYYRLSRNRPANSDFADHVVVSTTDSTTGWFARNEWYRFVYYAIAPNHAPGGTLSCADSGTVTCVQVTNFTGPAKQRAILVLAGRSLTTLSQTRPSALPANYLDSVANSDGADLIFVQSRISGTFNDRFISVSKNP